MMTTHETPANKAELLERVRAAQADLEDAISGLSDDQINQPDSDGGWSIKDHVGHIIGWQGHAISAIQGRMAHEGMGIERDQFANLHVDEINEILYARYRDRPPGEVCDELRAQHQRLVELVEGMSDDDLQRPYQSERSTSPRTVIDQVADISERHNRAHLGDIQRLAGTRN